MTMRMFGLVACTVLMLPLFGEPVKAVCTNALTTVWGRAVTPENAWREYPRPQLVRGNWTSLNGRWDYAVTSVTTDEPKCWDGQILVPFPIESPLSGVTRKVSPEEQIWYRRTFTASPQPGTRTILNFERVDFRASVFVNGVEALDVPHAGGNVPFSVDVTDFVRSGENELKVLVWDPTDTHVGGIGKQVLTLRTCFFGPVSGICGGVWLETVPTTYLADYQVKTDVDRRTVTIVPDVKGAVRRARVKVGVSFKGQSLASTTVPADEAVTLELPAPLHLWCCETPHLYDLAIEVIAPDGTVDRTTGYFGLRKVETKLDARGIRRVAVNGVFTYLLATLDQGWWPDGLLTPPSEAACRFDVDFHKQAGFNAIRKHIKIEPRAFYAYCDRLGVMVIQDIPSGSSDARQGDLAYANLRYGFYRRELKDCVDHLRNHPCIVMWNPFNEGWGQPSADKTRHVNKWLKRYDPSRLVNGPSGWNDYEGGTTLNYTHWSYADVSDPDVYTDCIDLHHYPDARMHPANATRVSILGEFGGLGVPLRGHVQNPRGHAYTLREVEDPAWRREQAARYEALVRPLPELARQGLGGSVFTEAQDQFWDLGGFVTFDRAVVKFDYAFLRKLHAGVLAAAREAAETPPPPSPKGPSIAWTASPTLDHGEWPRLHVLADGRYALTYSRVESAAAPYFNYALRFSSDQGRTWSPVQTVFRHFERPLTTGEKTVYMIHNPELTQLPANHPRHPGRLVATANLRPAKGPSSIGFSVSDDGGRTWRALQRLLPVAGESDAVAARRCWEPFVQVLPDGTLHLYYSDVKPTPGKPNERTVSCFVSTDGGDTWKGPRVSICRPGTWTGIPSALVWRDNLYVAHEAHPKGHPEWCARPYISQWSLAKPSDTAAPFYEPFTESTPNGVYRGAPYLVATENYFVLSAQTSHPQAGEHPLKATQLGVWVLPKRAVGPTGELKGFVPVANPLGRISSLLWSGLAPLGGDDVMATCQNGHSIILVRGRIR